MNYCTQQDLITRYGQDELIQLSDKQQNLGVIDESVVAAAIADADSLIDGYVGSRFPNQVNPYPRSLVRISCEIARYYLYENIVPDDVKDRYNEAVKSLKAISKGEISIGTNSEGEKPSSNNTVEMTTGGNVFNRNDKGFI